MKTYKIAVDYRICGVIDIQADTLKDALNKASTDGTTVKVYDKEYIDDTWNVNLEMSEEFNEEEE